MENHSDSESTQILGDWDSPPPSPPVKGGTRVSDKERGGSTSTAAGGGRGRGRVLPPWIDPSYEWGGGKWKEDGRKNKKKKQKKKSIEDLMNEYLRCLLDVVNMGYHPSSTNDYGSSSSSIDEEVLSLRILEFLFDPTKNDAAATVIGPRIEFDLSLSSTHVLNAILKHISVSELRPGMPELSKFNLLPFIAHKNMSFPLDKRMRDDSAMENNRTSAAAPTVLTDPVYYRDDDQPEQQQQAHTRSEQTTNNDIVVEGDEVVFIDRTAEQQPINNNGNDRETSSPSSDVRVKCTKDGAWLICGSDDESSDTGLVNKRANIPPRPENVCWKCERQEEEALLLLTCSRSECATKVHKECLNCQVHFDEDDNFHCPLCWYDRMTKEYIESDKLMHSAKRRLVKFLPLLSQASKRLLQP